MKQKELSILLRGITALCGLVWLFFAYVFGKTLVLTILEPDRLLAPTALLILMLIPALLALIDAWMIFTDIGRSRSFTQDNARRLRRISLCALIDVLLDLLLTVYTLCSNMPDRVARQPISFLSRLASGIDGQVLLFAAVAIGGLVAAIAAAALSHLTLKAAGLQEENDLTI